jgi:1-deoxy-D-xylulose-5-phosphate synthase
MVETAWRAAALLEKDGIRVTVVNARFAKPIDEEVLRSLSANHHTLVTIEEHTLLGGFGSAVVEALVDSDISFSRVVRLGVPDRFQTFGSREQLLQDCGLDPRSIAETVARLAPRRAVKATARGIESGVR